MSARWCCLPVILAVALTACDTGGTVGGITRTTADVLVVDASATSIDLLQNQSLDPANAGIVFGAGSACMTVDIISHGLSVRPAGTRTTTTPLPSFPAANERYLDLVVGTASALQPIEFRNSFAGVAGQAAVRFINASGSGSYDVFVTDPGAALGTPNASNILNGVASSYFNVPTTTQQVRLATNTSTTTAFDLGNVTLTAGTRAVAVLAAPLPGTTTARPFIFILPGGGSC